MRNHPLCLLLFFVLLAACERPSTESQIASFIPEPESLPDLATPTLIPINTATPHPTTTPLSPTLAPAPTTTPFFTGPFSPPCGQRLPLLPTMTEPTTKTIIPDPDSLAQLQARLPEAALPGLQRLFTTPDTVGLVAYRVGDEANGIFLNPDMQMPLASVVKLIHLVAYAEAASAGQLDPTSYVSLDTLEHYYLPNYDLGSHNRSVRQLNEADLILPNPDRIRLEDVPGMMIRFSSNAATDYLHMLLGQTTIEDTAVSLNLSAQTAPCPFLGQFMAMGNHTRQGITDRAAIQAYIDDPSLYGQEVALLTDAYTHDAAFRQEENEWHRQQRRPSVDNQRFFSHHLNAHGTARQYAGLMALLAQNGLSNPESSFLARRYLEWPMIYPDNQGLFSNLGYKSGSLPGILTTVYYAYPAGEQTPIVVVLFYRDLPSHTYRRWRFDLPHDEFARWLLADPQAIPALKAVLQTAAENLQSTD